MRTATALSVLLLSALLVVTAAAPARAFSISMIAGKEVKWSVQDVPYYVDADGWSGISNGSDVTAIVQSFDVWEGVSCSFLGFTQAGTTTSTAVLPLGSEPNGKNEVVWKEGYWPFSSYTLGVTSPIYSYTGIISEADIALNGTISWSASGMTWNDMDIQSVAVHEMGHLFGIGHVLQWDESDPPTMAPYVDPYGKSATLHQDDINGICYLYPQGGAYACSTNGQCPNVIADAANGEEYYSAKYSCSGGTCKLNPASSGNGDVGSSCGDDGDCKSGLFCLQTTEGSFCTKWCTAGTDCPNQFYCVEVDGSNKICFGSGVVGNGNFGEFCYQNSDCKSPYICMEWWSGNFCTSVCNDPTGGTGCPAKHTCYPMPGLPSGKGACMPGTAAKKENGTSCSQSSDCKSGMCFPTPGTDKKICRDSCSPSAPSCPANFKCVALPGDTTGTKGGCLPATVLPEKSDGVACSGAWECKSNYCYYDSEMGLSTCRSLCNPASPSCPAGTTCLTLTSGVGACLPLPPEPLPAGSWCQHHYDCVSGYCQLLPGTTDKYCRSTCTSGSGCKGAFECVFYDSPDVGVCMPLGKNVGAVCSSSTECTTQICWSEQGAGLCLLPCINGACATGYTCDTGTAYGPVCELSISTLAVGQSCDVAVQCMSQLCIAGICRQPCSVAAPSCPAGQGCVPVSSDTQGACVTPGALAPGADCTQDFECSSLLCVDTGTGRACAQACDPASGQCPDGTSCETLPELSGVGGCFQEGSTPGNPDNPHDPPDTQPKVSEPSGSCAAGLTHRAASPASLLCLLLAAAVLATAGAATGRQRRNAGIGFQGPSRASE